ncbi:unnamed protein product [Eruca vesicaria subsp. sativa]|uniref:PSI subunit V n=1 Tax=Eruca vesicaria subsp. sativa TaxID=29727 RepID=A0ABC8L1C6_ERUVS|nr:unnamed protein product [Eruca vesicaria subsp. sativa]
MAASASPMASQLKSSFSSASIARRLPVPKGISGPPFGVYPTKRISSFTVRAVQSDKEGEPSIAPSLTLTGRKKQPDQLQTAEGWAKFTGGFFFGGISGVTWAYFLLYVLDLPYYVK